jgi:TBC1 domain family member 15
LTRYAFCSLLLSELADARHELQVLKYTTQLSQTLDIEAIMADAEVLFVTFRQVVEASDRQRAAAASSSDPGKGGMRRRQVVVEKEPQGAAYPPTQSAKGKGKEVDGLEKEVVEVVVDKDVPEVDEELRVLLK